MKAGFQENFRFLVIFILVLTLMNFAFVGFDINRQNDYSNEVGQMIAKNGCLDHETEVKAAKLGHDRYHNMFWVTPAKSEKSQLMILTIIRKKMLFMIIHSHKTMAAKSSLSYIQIFQFCLFI